VKIIDLNILLYAVNSDAAHHLVVRRWWEETLNDDESVGLPWVVLLGFLRISTNARVFLQPLSPEAAIGKIDAWLSLDQVRVVREKDGHWDALRRLLAGAGTAGNLTTDAHLAALAISHDAILASCDADFARFKGLRWMNPAA
jgi:hypothetical protein